MGAAGSRTGPLWEYQRRYAAGPGRVPSKSGCTQPAVFIVLALTRHSTVCRHTHNLIDGWTVYLLARARNNGRSLRSACLRSAIAPVAGVSTMAAGVAPSFCKYCSVRYVSIDSTFCCPPAFQYPTLIHRAYQIPAKCLRTGAVHLMRLQASAVDI